MVLTQCNAWSYMVKSHSGVTGRERVQTAQPLFCQDELMLTDNERMGLSSAGRARNGGLSRIFQVLLLSRVGGRTTKLAERDDNTVRYCQARNIIAANWRGWLVVVGDEDGLSKVEGGCRGFMLWPYQTNGLHA